MDRTVEPIMVVPYDPEWSARFQDLAAQLGQALGDVALRIDHIGSTSIPGLAAKPVIDIQVSVASFDPLDAIRIPLERLGYVWRADNPDQTKRYFREPPGHPSAHIHVRKRGSWGEQFALLFRDYVRAHPNVAARYAELKLELAEEHYRDRAGYVHGKGPFIWATMAEATNWSQLTGWEPGPSDA